MPRGMGIWPQIISASFLGAVAVAWIIAMNGGVQAALALLSLLVVLLLVILMEEIG